MRPEAREKQGCRLCLQVWAWTEHGARCSCTRELGPEALHGAGMGGEAVDGASVSLSPRVPQIAGERALPGSTESNSRGAVESPRHSGGAAVRHLRACQGRDPGRG